MQRKLLVALIGIALASVLLVGLGLLLTARIGARDSARDDVREQFNVLGVLVENTGGARLNRRDLQQIERGLRSTRIEQVAVRDDGAVFPLAGQGSSRPSDLLLTLDLEELARFETGDLVLVDEGNEVIGVRRLNVRLPDNIDFAPGLSSRAPVEALDPGTRAWFVVSAIAVLAAAAAVATGLARRLVAPVVAIDSATRRIASGDLSTRVEIDSNDELGALGESVNAMATDLERSRALEQQFLMSVSHDLRTPLAAIQGYAEALTDGATDEPARAGAVIADHAGRLNRLVGDLLDLSRLNARQFRFDAEVFDLVAVVSNTLQGFEHRAADAGVELRQTSGAAPVMMNADPDRVGQVLSNLVDNALKFAASIVTVEVASRGRDVTMVVADDGAGIPDHDLPHVFERLYVTQQQPLRKESSSGLGLAIVRELSEAMGGATEVTSSTSGGTVFTVTLPADLPDGQAGAIDTRPSPI